MRPRPTFGVFVSLALMLALGGACAGCGRLRYDAGVGEDAGPDSIDAPEVDAHRDDATDTGRDASVADAATDAGEPASDGARPPSDAGGEDGGSVDVGVSDGGGSDATDSGCPPYFVDLDLDGAGTGAPVGARCGSPPAGHASSDDDCDDRNIGRHPGAMEGCNALDDDCDLRVDESAACTGVMEATRVTGLEWANIHRSLDVGATGELLVLGTLGGVGRVLELEHLRGGPASVPITSRTWIRATPERGWVVGSSLELASYASDGSERWRRLFSGMPDDAWSQACARISGDRLVIAGDLLGSIDLGRGSIDFTPQFASLVAELDAGTGDLRWIRADGDVSSTSALLLPSGATGIAGFFETGPASFGGGPATARPLSVVRLGSLGDYVGEWNSSRPVRVDEAILGLEAVSATEVIFAADYDGGTFEGFPTVGRGAIVARVSIATGVVDWVRSYPISARTNAVVQSAIGGRLVCFEFDLRTGASDWGDGVMTTLAGHHVVCFDILSGTTRFAFPNPNAGAVAVGPTGIVYTTARGATGELLVIPHR